MSKPNEIFVGQTVVRFCQLGTTAELVVTFDNHRTDMTGEDCGFIKKGDCYQVGIDFYKDGVCKGMCAIPYDFWIAMTKNL